MPAFLLSILANVLESLAVPAAQWVLRGSVRVLERHYGRRGAEVPGKLYEAPTRRSVAS